MSKNSNKMKENKTKSNSQKDESFKIQLSMFQYQIISLIIFIITGQSKWDVLSDILYDALRCVEHNRFRPLLFDGYAIRAGRWQQSTDSGKGTSLSGKGLVAFNIYVQSWTKVVGDEFFMQDIEYGEMILSILSYYICSRSEWLRRFANEVPVMALIGKYRDEKDYVRLCIINCEKQIVEDHMYYDINEFIDSIRSGSASSILKDEATPIMGALYGVNNQISTYANSVILRLIRLISDGVKTGKFKIRRWKKKGRKVFLNDDSESE